MFLAIPGHLSGPSWIPSTSNSMDSLSKSEYIPTSIARFHPDPYFVEASFYPGNLL